MSVVPLPNKAHTRFAAAERIKREPTVPRADISFLSRYLVQVTFPHSNPGNGVQDWSRRNGDLFLEIKPGSNPFTRESYGVPYGTIPRLLLHWLTCEVLRKQERRLELGKSMSQFMNDLGLYGRSGGTSGNITRVKDQMTRLFKSTISLTLQHSARHPDSHKWLNMFVAPQGEFWWDPCEEQESLWPSYVVLGEEFYYALSADPVPLDKRALRVLKSSSLDLDLYAWLSHKVYSLSQNGQTHTIRWAGLEAQMGSQFKHVRDFRRAIMDGLNRVGPLIPGLKYEIIRGAIVISPPVRKGAVVSLSLLREGT